MGIRRGITRLVLLGSALLAGGVWGDEVYRCQTENDVVYQDFPCEGEGEQIDLPTNLPEPSEVKKLRQRQAEMRLELEAIERQRQREEAAEARTSPEVVVIQPVDEEGGGDDEDSTSTSTCPLGLGNCKKTDARVFRRPADTAGERPSPLGLRNRAGESATERGGDDAGGSLAEPE